MQPPRTCCIGGYCLRPAVELWGNLLLLLSFFPPLPPPHASLLSLPPTSPSSRTPAPAPTHPSMSLPPSRPHSFLLVYHFLSLPVHLSLTYSPSHPLSSHCSLRVCQGLFPFLPSPFSRDLLSREYDTPKCFLRVHLLARHTRICLSRPNSACARITRKLQSLLTFVRSS